MSYFSDIEDPLATEGLGCGAQCKCGPCKSGLNGLDEWYERQPDEEAQGPAPPPAPMPRPTPSSMRLSGWARPGFGFGYYRLHTGGRFAGVPARYLVSPTGWRLGEPLVAVAQGVSTTSGFEVDGPATPSLGCIQRQQLQRRQITFIVRYLRDLTRPEARAITAAGLQIVSCWQLGPQQQRPYFTRARGLTDGRRAFTAAQAIGQPANTPIYFAVDYDAFTDQDRAAVLAYFEGVRDALNQQIANNATSYVIGVYGNGCVLAWCQAQGIVTFFWQAFAPGWCNNRPIWAGANLHTFGLDTPLTCNRRLGRVEGWGNEGGWTLPVQGDFPLPPRSPFRYA